MKNLKSNFGFASYLILKQILKNTFGGLSREVWLLSAVMFINRSGTMVVAFLSVYLTQELHFSLIDAGFILAAYGVGSLTGTWLGGKLTDILGNFPVQFFSLFIGGIMFLVTVQTQHFPTLIILAFFLSVTGEAYRPANNASIAEFSNHQNFTRSVSLVRLAINLGWSIGPALGGFLAAINYKWLFYVDGFTNIMAAGLVFLFLRKSHKKRDRKIVNITSRESVLKDRIFVVFIVFVTFYAIAFFQIFTIGPLFFKRDCGFSEQEIGLLLGVNGLLVVLIEMFLIAKIDGKYQKLRLISFGVFLVVINFVFFAFTHNYWLLMLGIVFATFSEIFAMPYMNTFSLERATPQNRGAYSGLYSMTWAIASVFSPFLSTQVIDKFGFQALWIVLGSLSLVATFGFVFIGRFLRKAF